MDLFRLTEGHLQALRSLHERMSQYADPDLPEVEVQIRLDFERNMRAELIDTDGVPFGEYVYVDADGHPHGTRRAPEQIRPDRWYIHAETGMPVHGADALERGTPVHGLTAAPHTAAA